MKNLNFCFDGRFINPSHPDGISSFSVGLIRELAKLTNLTVLVNSEAQQELLGQLQFKMVNSPTSALEPFLGYRLRKENFDVLFSPMQTTGSLGRNFKLILTLHDLIYYRHKSPPKAFNPLVRLAWYLFHLSYWPQRLLLNKADAIVSVSETTKKQMLDARLTKRQIHVIHNASDEPVSVSGQSRNENRDLCYMGSFIGYKNVEFLVAAMGLLPEHRLVLLSRVSPKIRKKLEEIAKQNNANIHFTDGVSASEYTDWLANCQALVSASLDEGFGIPLVEAMNHGTPIVVTDMDIFREIAGESGLFFDPSSKEDFADQVKKLARQEVWLEKSNQASKQAGEFDWKRSAQELLELAQGLRSPGF